MSNDHVDEKEEKREAARMVISEWNKEQERKKSTGITVSEAVRLHNEDVAVRGIIVAISELIKMVKQRTSICKNDSCSYKLEIEIYDQPKFVDIHKKYKSVCPACNSSDWNILYDYVNAISIKIQDDEPDGELEQLTCLLFDGDTLNVRPGETIIINGHIEVEKHKGRLHPVLHAQGVKYERKKESEITSKNIESFKRFAKIPKVADRLVGMFAPKVIEQKPQKLGILRSLVGAPETISRGRIHTLLIGPPGVTKSMLAREAVEVMPNSRFVTAQNASGKGVTAIIDKEYDTTILRLGAVPQARGSVCVINEIGRMDFEDQGFLLDVMEEGTFTVDKYAIHVSIKSPTTIIATANPTGVKWNDPFRMSNSEIPVLGTLLDRFDQVYAVNEFGSEEEKHVKNFG